MNWQADDHATTQDEAQQTVTRRRPSHVENLDRTWPQGDHSITLEEAREMIARRRRAAMESGGAFEKDALMRLLSHPQCAGMRIYYGMHPDGRPCLVLVGVDQHGEEILEGELLEKNYPCPPFCAIGPSLRSGA